jgi:hypothetical protein
MFTTAFEGRKPTGMLRSLSDMRLRKGSLASFGGLGSRLGQISRSVPEKLATGNYWMSLA